MTMRYLVPVAAAVSLVAFLGVPYVDHILAGWFRSDVQMRARLVMTSIEDPLGSLLDRSDLERARTYLGRVAGDERLLGVVVCAPDGSRVVRTPLVPDTVLCATDGTQASPGSTARTAGPGLVEVSRFPLLTAAGHPYEVLIVHDLSFIGIRQTSARNFVLAFTLLAACALAMLAGFGIRLLLNHWIRLLVGDISSKRFLDDAESSQASMPVLMEVREALRELEASQRLEIEFQENWTPQALQQVVRDHLKSCPMIVVSNREPYIHNLDGSGNGVVQVPASGMVTAIEPIMRACSGTWIAHGSGTADRLVVDKRDHVHVPPDDPSYDLRRVWLTQAEEEGYYYGFSNEGLWPLCHLAYVRPAFRESDWHQYVEVNGRFADVVAQESHRSEPVVLIQDFHFALLPKLIRDRGVHATIALFWHIPWPNAETFGVCPWKREILLHMLSADILGFHTRYHCQNFLATVDRFIECQIDQEHMTVTHQGHVCRVKAYPISIEWPPRWLAQTPSAEAARTAVRQRWGIGPDVRIGVGVERWDFTKGIVERFLAIETLFEKHPEWIGRLTFLQVAAPSRSKLPAYQALQQQTLDELHRINARFGNPDWQPIVLIGQHQEPAQVFELYRAADFCLVNSLHDGMNLVAKEFVAARDDEDGVLVLSTFTGASRELVEALLVNPFDVSETAGAIVTALEMPRDERRKRMQLMRRTISEANVYRWAGRMLMDVARIRQRQALTRWTAAA
ncbi:MAG: trehalose-6-phosphate synthase [Gammaproteobacteria bacterium]|nr:trehalose-6-phosphate synthase [Gammaproteobacteria bacterium]